MGELFALLTAVVWAGAVICFKRSGDRVAPFTLNLFRVVYSSVLLLVTMAIVGQPLLRAAASTRDLELLVLSGVVGIAISDTLFHAALNRVGAGITAIVDCLYSPIVSLLAFAWLGERLSPQQVVGMVLVIAGVLTTVRRTEAHRITQSQLVAGILFGVLAMATVAAGIVIAKPVLDHQPVIWATGVRQVAALGVLLPVALVSRDRRRHLEALVPGASGRWTLVGTLLGSYVALLLWIAGMKYADTGVAAILNQTSTVLILVLATLVLREPFTRRRAAACGLALAGTLCVVLG